MNKIENDFNEMLELSKEVKESEKWLVLGVIITAFLNILVKYFISDAEFFLPFVFGFYYYLIKHHPLTRRLFILKVKAGLIKD